LSLAVIEKVADAMVAADGEARRGPTWAVVDDVEAGAWGSAARMPGAFGPSPRDQ
jgi:phenylpyruvate tautomerase PptA (4-oxalocrotonate tautomerase family)